MSVWSECMHVYHTHAWRIQRPERLSDPLSWSYRCSSLTIVSGSFCPSCHIQVTIERRNSNYKSSAYSSGLLQTNSHNLNSPVYINLHSDMWHCLSFILHLLFSSLCLVGNSSVCIAKVLKNERPKNFISIFIITCSPLDELCI